MSNLNHICEEIKKQYQFCGVITLEPVSPDVKHHLVIGDPCADVSWKMYADNYSDDFIIKSGWDGDIVINHLLFADRGQALGSESHHHGDYFFRELYS